MTSRLSLFSCFLVLCVTVTNSDSIQARERRSDNVSVTNNHSIHAKERRSDNVSVTKSDSIQARERQSDNVSVTNSDSIHTKGRRSDDVSAQSLQTVVQQQAALLDKQTAQLSSLQTQVTAMAAELSALKQSQQEQAAFSVTFSGAQLVLNIGENAVIKFDRVITNVGQGYNPLSGLFTAPCDGTYAFFISLRSDNAHDWLSLGIFKGDTMLTVATADGASDLYDKGSAFVTTPESGDVVYVKHSGAQPIWKAAG